MLGILGMLWAAAGVLWAVAGVAPTASTENSTSTGPAFSNTSEAAMATLLRVWRATPVCAADGDELLRVLKQFLPPRSKKLAAEIDPQRSLDLRCACCGNLNPCDLTPNGYSRHTSAMNFARPITFWIAMLAAAIAVVVLSREVLLPFVAGAALAYLLDPLATRLERAEMNRLVATLAIVGLFIAGVVALMALTAPIIVDEVAYFVDSVPLYLKQLRGLATDQSRPWLSKIIGEGLRQAEQSFGELTTLALGIGIRIGGVGDLECELG